MDPITLNAAELQSPSTSLSKKIDAITVKPTSDSVNGQSAANEANSYNKYDTMELSPEYVGYRTKSENAGVNSDTQQFNSTVDQKTVKPPVENSEINNENSIVTEEKKPLSAASDDTSEQSISSNELASYTDSQLKGLVLAGKISTATYNAEMKNRQDDNTTTTQQTPKKTVVQSNSKATNSIF